MSNRLINSFVLKMEHMVLKKERFRIESLASKTTISVLRLFIEKPYAQFSISDISRIIGISKSNVLRGLRALLSSGMIRIARGGIRKLFKIDSGKRIVKAAANLFMEERIENLKPKTKNAVEYLFSEIGMKVDAFILFGSCAYGLETSKSDIDILVISKNEVKISSAQFLPYRFEIHSKTWEEVTQLKDFVALDAILSGIVFKGSDRLFEIRAGIESFPKAYALFRLKKIKEYEEKTGSADSMARKYYKELIRISLGELESLLFEGKIIPKKSIQIKRTIEEIEDKLGNEGDRIWLKKT